MFSVKKHTNPAAEPAVLYVYIISYTDTNSTDCTILIPKHLHSFLLAGAVTTVPA
jgi:hypothetical protein